MIYHHLRTLDPCPWTPLCQPDHLSGPNTRSITLQIIGPSLVDLPLSSMYRRGGQCCAPLLLRDVINSSNKLDDDAHLCHNSLD